MAAASAAARVKYTVNDAWRFTKGSPYNAFLPAADDSAWEVVNIPHTWNAEDAVDDVPGFYRGPAWYRKRIVLPADAASKQVYLCFEGANQVVRLYVNGHYAGKHTGGYTRFVFDITKYIVPGGRKPLRRRGGQRPRSRHSAPVRRLHLLRRHLPRREPADDRQGARGADRLRIAGRLPLDPRSHG